MKHQSITTFSVIICIIFILSLFVPSLYNFELIVNADSTNIMSDIQSEDELIDYHIKQMRSNSYGFVNSSTDLRGLIATMDDDTEALSYKSLKALSDIIGGSYNVDSDMFQQELAVQSIFTEILCNPTIFSKMGDAFFEAANQKANDLLDAISMCQALDEIDSIKDIFGGTSDTYNLKSELQKILAMNDNNSSEFINARNVWISKASTYADDANIFKKLFSELDLIGYGIELGDLAINNLNELYTYCQLTAGYNALDSYMKDSLHCYCSALLGKTYMSDYGGQSSWYNVRANAVNESFLNYYGKVINNSNDRYESFITKMLAEDWQTISTRAGAIIIEKVIIELIIAEACPELYAILKGAKIALDVGLLVWDKIDNISDRTLAREMCYNYMVFQDTIYTAMTDEGMYDSFAYRLVKHDNDSLILYEHGFELYKAIYKNTLMYGKQYYEYLPANVFGPFAKVLELEAEKVDEMTCHDTITDNNAYCEHNLIKSKCTICNQVNDSLEYKQIKLGKYYSAVITEDSNLYMWGNNEYGQLGNGTKENSLVPIKIMDNVKSVFCRDYYSAAITKDGSLYTWGYNYLGYGRLGNGTTENSLVPVKIMDNVKSVYLNTEFSAAITEDGSLYMWGANYYGQFGNGTTESSLTPVKIMDNVISAAFGYGFSAVIKKDGSLYMWGHNKYGQLGIGTTKSSLVPVKVMDNVKSIFIKDSTNFVIKNDDSLYTWGANYYGQVGNGTTENSLVPIKIMDNINSIFIDSSNIFVIKKDGGLYSWGTNSCGELGNGDTKRSLIPIKIMDSVKSVYYKDGHSAAIKEDGSLYMWGINNYGQLGNGDTKRSLIPIKIMDSVKSISLSNGSSAAMTDDGSLYMWGHNKYGELGNGTTENSLIPIKIEVPPLDNSTYVEGDVNGDGVIGIADLVALQNFLLAKSEDISVNADINQDKVIDVFDLCLLRKMVLQQIA